MVKHHDVVGRYVTIEVDDCEYKVFYLQNGKGIPLICQHTAGCHNHQWRGLLEDEEIIKIDTFNKVVYSKTGDYGYDTLVFATGAKSIVPPIKNIEKATNWSTCRSMIDFDKITQEGLASNSEHITVIGAGLIGVEVAENLKDAGKEVTLIEGDKQILNMWQQKFGNFAETVLKEKGIKITAYVNQVGHLKLEKGYKDLDFSQIEKNPVRCADANMAIEMENHIREVRKAGDTIGGVVNCVIQGVESGLGEPVFDKLHAELGKAMLSINAAKGFEYGSGFAGVSMRGSEHNDIFEQKDGKTITQTNHSGGIQGGISNGMDIYFKVAFKPVATIMQSQKTINKQGQATDIVGKGRHDACVLPRAVPIVEAMAALVIADFLLRKRSNRL